MLSTNEPQTALGLAGCNGPWQRRSIAETKSMVTTVGGSKEIWSGVW